MYVPMRPILSVVWDWTDDFRTLVKAQSHLNIEGKWKPHMRWLELCESASAGQPVSFNLKHVVDELINEMAHGELAHTDDYIIDFNDMVEAGEIVGEPIDEDEERPWRFPQFMGFLQAKAVAIFNSLHVGQSIRAWRAIVADENWTPETAGRHIGLHWTYNKKLAIPYDYDEGTHVYVIEAIIPDSSIDWTDTVIHHMTRDVDEQEITILDGAPVQIVKVVKKIFNGL
jgi:hypothetical protein